LRINGDERAMPMRRKARIVTTRPERGKRERKTDRSQTRGRRVDERGKKQYLQRLRGTEEKEEGAAS